MPAWGSVALVASVASAALTASALSAAVWWTQRRGTSALVGAVGCKADTARVTVFPAQPRARALGPGAPCPATAQRPSPVVNALS